VLRYIPGTNEYDFYHGAKIVIFGEKDKRGVLSGELGVGIGRWELGVGRWEWGVGSFKFQVSGLASPRVKLTYSISTFVVPSSSFLVQFNPFNLLIRG
jgi:hypothetical protein